jgi:glutamate racemase
MDKSDHSCIGLLDSGLGGLSILKEIRLQMPNIPVYYVADQAHVPYGKRALAEIRAFTFAITRFLLQEKSVKLIVIACNTASAAALNLLREEFPGVPFIGMEPAVKPAANNTKSGAVGVLATPATFEAEMFQSLVERFAADIQVVTNTAPGLVEAVEAGALNHPGTRRIIEAGVRPMLEQGVDTIVLGCTHFPLVMSLFREVVGEKIDIIDPAPAIARRTQFLMKDLNIQCHIQKFPLVTYATTGNVDSFGEMVCKIMGEDAAAQQLLWRNGELKTKK